MKKIAARGSSGYSTIKSHMVKIFIKLLAHGDRSKSSDEKQWKGLYLLQTI